MLRDAAYGLRPKNMRESKLMQFEPGSPLWIAAVAAAGQIFRELVVIGWKVGGRLYAAAYERITGSPLPRRPPTPSTQLRGLSRQLAELREQDEAARALDQTSYRQ